MSAQVWFTSLVFGLLTACHLTHGDSEPKVTNGVLDIGDLGVVMIEGFNPGAELPARCTASLIRPDILLTAAHCVIDHDTRQVRRIRTAGADSRRMIAFKTHPLFENEKRYDVALLKLERPVAEPRPLALSTTLPRPDDWMRVVGFGGNQYTDVRGVTPGSGVKRTGWTKVTHLDDHFIYTRGMRTATPSGESRPTGRDVALAHGDSGGPMLSTAGQIVGIAAAVNSQHVSPKETLSIIVAHTQVAAVIDFIERALDELSE